MHACMNDMYVFIYVCIYFLEVINPIHCMKVLQSAQNPILSVYSEMYTYILTCKFSVDGGLYQWFLGRLF